jgi:hypothetical protein
MPKRHPRILPSMTSCPEPLPPNLAAPSSCRGCRFYLVRAGGLGLCRRYPPVPFLGATPTPVGPQALHPVVTEDWVCGEHELLNDQ